MIDMVTKKEFQDLKNRVRVLEEFLGLREPSVLHVPEGVDIRDISEDKSIYEFPDTSTPDIEQPSKKVSKSKTITTKTWFGRE